jgi:hypothetical protein
MLGIGAKRGAITYAFRVFEPSWSRRSRFLVQKTRNYLLSAAVAVVITAAVLEPTYCDAYGVYRLK